MWLEALKAKVLQTWLGGRVSRIAPGLGACRSVQVCCPGAAGAWWQEVGGVLGAGGCQQRAASPARRLRGHL